MRSPRETALRWGASLALLLPVLLLYGAECLRGDGQTFTGFIQYDQPSYMASARKFFDGEFHLLYGNPFSPDAHTPAIYFQIHLLVLGLIEKATGWDPGVVYVIFGFFAALVCVRVAMALYEEIAGLRTAAEWVGLVLFIWGGGILALLGLASHLIAAGGGAPAGLFRFDPDGGWWFLNLGRNLVFPTEAYYHALALGSMLMAIRRNFRATMGLGFMLILSHPFTGLQFILILTAWAGIESVVLRNRAVPFLFAGTMGCLLLFHLLYYVLLLNLFPEHRAIFAQWSLAWNESVVSAVGADLLVGILALWSVRSSKLAQEVVANPTSRLLVTWLVVSLLLAHHDLFMHPRQPLHFSRGYTWIALFLLGIRPLLELLNRGFARRRVLARAGTVGLVLVLGLSDNLVWFGFQTAAALAPRWGNTNLPRHAFAMSDDERGVFRWLNDRPEPHLELLVAANPDSTLPYLGTVYTDYRGWYTHFASTPFAVARRREVAVFANSGVPAPGWAGKAVLYIVSKADSRAVSKASIDGDPVFENGFYLIFLFRPGGKE